MYKVADVDGSWLTNTGRFPVVDPESGTRFEPGEVIKATVTAWVKDQAIIAKAQGPESKVAAQAKAEAKAKASPKARGESSVELEQGMPIPAD